MSSVLNPDAITIRTAFWHRSVNRLYGLDSEIIPLVGEYDLNFRLNNEQGDPVAVFKVMREDCDRELVELQCQLLAHVAQQNHKFPVPSVIPTLSSTPFAVVPDEGGNDRFVWMITWMDGHLYANVHPHSLGLSRAVGRELAKLDASLRSFDHPALHREMKWDLQQAGWVEPHLELIEPVERHACLKNILGQYRKMQEGALASRPKQAIHNDVNDYNLLVDSSSEDDSLSLVTGIIDFGDAIAAPVVCNLAITAAYLVLDHDRPVDALVEFVAGYHKENALHEDDLSLLWPLLLTRLAVSVTNSAIMKLEKPDDPYVVISEKPAWDFLDKFSSLDAARIEMRLRVVCAFPVTRRSPLCVDWLEDRRGSFASVMAVDLESASTVDLSVNGCAVPSNPLINKVEEFAPLIDLEKGHAIIGHYAEPRMIYTHRDFFESDNNASRRRTVHLGVDIFYPAGEPVYTPCDAVVHAVAIRPDPLDYGGVLVLEHFLDESDSSPSFYTLYGHLAHEVADRLKPGMRLKQGDLVAYLGDETQNGGWPAHLHFQVAMDTLGKGCDIDGVADPDLCDYLLELYPNPAALLNLPDDKVAALVPDTDRLLQERARLYPANLKLSYREPLPLVRGWKHYLYDTSGRTYLDAYNNVPHVGHAHPRLTQVAKQQIASINTNTRYLHPLQIDYAEKLASLMPDPLNVCLFVTSGSEANELAVRLARAATGSSDMLVMESGYHGHTNTTIDLSEYKFNGKGGRGKQDWVNVLPVPDIYRGEYRGSDQSHRYAEEAALMIRDRFGKAGSKPDTGKLCALLCETYPSVGGQIVVPDGYYQAVYEAVREVGGLCIADEVQTGLGRLGNNFWGFQSQKVVPDIVVLGKPLGNGYPMAAVVTTREIADAFVTGMEFFSTFGGNTLSCAIGLEVLQIIEDEKLDENASKMGQHFLIALKQLSEKHELIGDVRGEGLFLGVELVTDRQSRTPATAQAAYVINRMREERILIGSDGPDGNVLKIRPPMTIGTDDVDYLIGKLDAILAEKFCQPTP